jgi:transcriptional regulator with XRE-family HTH domain
MEHSGKPTSPVDTIRHRVKQLRGHRGWTGAELGTRLTRLGARWDRSIVANFEAGRRRTVSVTELLALAIVFDVAPVNLLVPLDDRPYQVTPTRAENSDLVRSWVRGEQPLPGTDERTYRTEVSLADLHKEHTTTLEEQAHLLARSKRISLSDAFREMADRLDQDGPQRRNA